MTANQIRPEQAISEAAALGEKIARGATLFSKLRDNDVAIATTPKDEVWHQDKVSLHHYRPLAEQKIATPVLIVYGLIGRYTMADLQEDRSLVRNLLKLGVDLYVVDWGNPSRAADGLRWMTTLMDIWPIVLRRSVNGMGSTRSTCSAFAKAACSPCAMRRFIRRP